MIHLEQNLYKNKSIYQKYYTNKIADEHNKTEVKGHTIVPSSITPFQYDKLTNKSLIFLYSL